MNSLKTFIFGLITGVIIFGTSDIDLFASAPVVKSTGSIIKLNKAGASPMDFIQVRRGGGRSMGGSRRSTTSRTNRQTTRSNQTRMQKAPPSKQPSFGGTRMSSSAAKSKYGTPRKTSTVAGKNGLGESVNYRVNNYGGYSSGLMMGYMTGQMTSMMWMGSMFYTRPVYVTDEDGMTSVYPPTFSFTRVLILLLVIYVIYRIIKSIFGKKNAAATGSSSGSFG